MEKAISMDFPLKGADQLGITAVGRSDTLPGHRYGPAVRPYYLIHYILAGAGEFTVDNISYHLHAGQGFLIEPNYRTVYIADDAMPWSYVWLGFAGDAAPWLVDQLAISEKNPVFNCGHSFELADCVNQVLQLKQQTPANHLRALSYLLRFLSYIAEGTTSDFRPGQVNPNPYVDAAIHYIATHLATATVDQVAGAVNIDRSYLAGLFKCELDLTPSEYLRNFRITTARHLLESSTLNINQVAAICGYAHPNSFARLFKQTYGLSPRQYRQQNRQRTADR